MKQFKYKVYIIFPFWDWAVQLCRLVINTPTHNRYDYSFLLTRIKYRAQQYPGCHGLLGVFTIVEIYKRMVEETNKRKRSHWIQHYPAKALKFSVSSRERWGALDIFTFYSAWCSFSPLRHAESTKMNSTNMFCFPEGKCGRFERGI